MHTQQEVELLETILRAAEKKGIYHCRQQQIANPFLLKTHKRLFIHFKLSAIIGQACIVPAFHAALEHWRTCVSHSVSPRMVCPSTYPPRSTKKQKLARSLAAGTNPNRGSKPTFSCHLRLVTYSVCQQNFSSLKADLELKVKSQFSPFLRASECHFSIC